MVEFTSNYDLAKPSNSDMMSAVDTYLNDNWTAIESIPAPPSVSGNLPQIGYNLYDRVYRTNDESIYILVVKDPDWGYHWRPVHAPLSPWIQLSVNAMESSYVPGTYPLRIAYDNIGRVHWNGDISYSPGVPASNSSVSVFKTLPKGLRPASSDTFMLGIHTANLAGSGLNMWQGARLYLESAGHTTGGLGIPGYNSVRQFGGTAASQQLQFNFSYAVGEDSYLVP